MNRTMKLCALGCCVVYILAVLFLPFFSISLMGSGSLRTSGMDIMSFSFWPFLPVIMGIVMGVCAMMLPGLIGGIVSIVGAFVPLMAYQFARSDIISKGIGLISGYGADGFAQLGSAFAGSLIRVGAGVILAIILGIGSGVLCFLSENGRKPVSHSAGLTANDEDEW